jgi:hypothetical protein
MAVICLDSPPKIPTIRKLRNEDPEFHYLRFTEIACCQAGQGVVQGQELHGTRGGKGFHALQRDQHYLAFSAVAVARMIHQHLAHGPCCHRQKMCPAGPFLVGVAGILR